MNIKPKPFVKWAGGKRQLVNELLKNKPTHHNRYFEPFVGGGALFFEIAPDKAYISDVNADLINTYKVIKNHVDKLITDLKKHKYKEDYFYELRNLDRRETFQQLSPVERASRFIYLNKTCFNGLYRVNSQGFYNVPFGFYKNPKIVDEENLRACSKALSNTRIKNTSFSALEKFCKEGDFVYFDPPYIPISKTSYFTSYSKEGFSSQEQEALRDLFNMLTTKGVYCMLSNSSSEEVRKMYKDYSDEIYTVNASRIINCKSEKRGKIQEVIITNYNHIHANKKYRQRKYA
jgi:DNA adenine methylase